MGTKEVEVDVRDLEYVYDEINRIRSGLLSLYMLGQDVPDPYTLDGARDILRVLLELGEEDDSDEEEDELGSLELRFDE